MSKVKKNSTCLDYGLVGKSKLAYKLVHVWMDHKLAYKLPYIEKLRRVAFGDL